MSIPRKIIRSGLDLVVWNQVNVLMVEVRIRRNFNLPNPPPINLGNQIQEPPEQCDIDVAALLPDELRQVVSDLIAMRAQEVHQLQVGLVDDSFLLEPNQ